MKKFVVFCLLCSFLFSISLFEKDFNFSKQENLSIQVFLSNRDYENLEQYSCIENGNGAIVFCNYDEYKSIKKQCKDISGVTFIFDGNEDVFNNIIKQLKVSTSKTTKYNFIGYTNYFDGCVCVDGKKTNIQGYLSDNKIYIGFPLLLGSY